MYYVARRWYFKMAVAKPIKKLSRSVWALNWNEMPKASQKFFEHVQPKQAISDARLQIRDRARQGGSRIIFLHLGIVSSMQTVFVYEKDEINLNQFYRPVIFDFCVIRYGSLSYNLFLVTYIHENIHVGYSCKMGLKCRFLEYYTTKN